MHFHMRCNILLSALNTTLAVYRLLYQPLKSLLLVLNVCINISLAGKGLIVFMSCRQVRVNRG